MIIIHEIEVDSFENLKIMKTIEVALQQHW